MKIRYLEIVTPEVDGTIAMFEQSLGASFSAPIAELGHARVADMSGGGRLAVRAPMHEDEAPVTRSYFAADNIDTATAQASGAGAELAHPVMEIPGQGQFSIVFQGQNQFGFWQD